MQGFCVVDDLGGCTESGPQPATGKKFKYWAAAFPLHTGINYLKWMYQICRWSSLHGNKCPCGFYYIFPIYVLSSLVSYVICIQHILISQEKSMQLNL